jgi:hypothetical protein
VNTLAESPSVVVNRLARLTRHYLGNLEYRQTGRGPKTNGFAFAAVPESALRQHLHALEALAATLEAA